MWKNKNLRWAGSLSVVAFSLGMGLLNTSIHFPSIIRGTLDLSSTAPVTIPMAIDGVSLRIRYQINGTGSTRTLRVLEVTKAEGETQECRVCDGRMNNLDISISSRTAGNAQDIRDRINDTVMMRVQQSTSRLDTVQVSDRNGRRTDYRVELRQESGQDGRLQARVRPTTEANCTSCERTINLPSNIRSFEEIVLRIQSELGRNSNDSTVARRDETDEDRRERDRRTGSSRLDRILRECRDTHGTNLTASSLSRARQRINRARSTTLESVMREIETTDDGDSAARSQELRCRVDKFRDIIRNGSNAREVSANAAKSFLTQHIRPHLMAALMDQSEENSAERDEASRMIEDLQGEPAREYSSLRSIITSLSSQTVRDMAQSIRTRFQRAAELERHFPEQSQLMLRLAVAEQSNLMELHGRLANANMIGLDSAIGVDGFTQGQAHAQMNRFFLNTGAIMACNQSGYRDARSCSGLLLSSNGAALSTPLSNPVYRQGVVHQSTRGRGVSTRNANGQIVTVPSATSGFQAVQPGQTVRMGLTL